MRYIVTLRNGIKTPVWPVEAIGEFVWFGFVNLPDAEVAGDGRRQPHLWRECGSWRAFAEAPCELDIVAGLPEKKF